MWWAQPLSGKRTDLTANQSLRLEEHSGLIVTLSHEIQFELFKFLIGYFWLSASKQEVVVDPYLKRVKTENSRYHSWQKQTSSQQGVVWQHWKALRSLLTNERGAWANRYETLWFIREEPACCPWPLRFAFPWLFLHTIVIFPFVLYQPDFNQRWNGNCPVQKPIQRCVSNLCLTTTMILTLSPVPWGTTWVCSSVQTYYRFCFPLSRIIHGTCFLCACMFSGADSPRSSEPLPLAVAKEAKVSDMEDDQLGEEDLVFLDDKWVFSLQDV